MRRSTFIVLLSLSFFVLGCAHVEIWDKKPRFVGLHSEGRTGIPLYPPAPHLLLRYTPASAKASAKLETELLMLPDMSSPYYVVPKGGWGTANAQMTLAGGVLTNFQQSTDSKGPETIGAVAGLAKDVAGAIAQLAPLSSPGAAAGAAEAIINANAADKPWIALYRLTFSDGETALVPVTTSDSLPGFDR